MRPPKEIWTNNYNEYILDLYDANPMVQTPNGTTKKAPEPNKNPRKTEASPKESSGNLTTIVTESLRLRNTAVLNVKLAEKIFKWEKERLAKIKPFPDPKDDDDEGGEIIIEDIDEDDFKFPRFRFPKPPKPPKPKPKTKPKPDPGPVRKPSWQFPKIPVIPPVWLPDFEGIYYFGARPAFSAPAMALAKGLAQNTQFPRTFVKPAPELERVRTVETAETIAEGSGGNTRVNRSGSRLPKETEVGGPGGGSGRSSTATMERPGGGGPGGKKTKRFGTNAGGTNAGGGGVNPKKKNLNKKIKIPDSNLKLTEFAKNAIMKNFGNLSEFDIAEIQSAYQQYGNMSLSELQQQYAGLSEERLLRNQRTGTDIPPSNQERVLKQLIKNKSKKPKINLSNVFKIPGSKPGNRNLSVFDSSIIPDPITGELPADKLFRQNLTKGSRLKAGGLALAGLDIGLTALDFMDRKAGGQSDLQATVGAGSSLVGGTIFGGAAAAKTAAALSPLIVMPVPGSRVVYGAAVLLAGLIGGTMGSYGGGTLADMITGADGVPDFRKAAPKLNDVNIVRNFLNPVKLTDSGFIVDPNKKAPTVDTGYVTGPSKNIGGSAPYHIDAKFSKSMSDDQMIDMMDMLALGYLQQNREIEFSNKGVKGFHWNVGLSREQKLDLIKRVRNAHEPREGFHSIDYYVPLVGGAAEDVSAEGAPILAPRIEGTTIKRFTDPDRVEGYGKYVNIVDENGNIIMRIGHGDVNVGPSGGTIKIKKPQEVSSRVLNTDEDGNDEEDAMMMFDSIFRTGTLIGSQPDITPLPIPIQIPQPESSDVGKSSHYASWGHQLTAG